jgi:hypothetical protein
MATENGIMSKEQCDKKSNTIKLIGLKHDQNGDWQKRRMHHRTAITD